MGELPSDLDSFEKQFDLAPQKYITVRSTKTGNNNNNLNSSVFRSAGANARFKTNFMAGGSFNMKNNAITRKIGSFLTRKPKKDNLSETTRATVDFFRNALEHSREGLIVRTDEEAEAEKQKREGVPFAILHPYSKRRLGWDILSMCLLFYSIMSVPVKTAFDFTEQNGCSTNFFEQDWHWYTDLLVDFAFMIDLVMNLRTAYFHPVRKSELVTDSWSIFVNYFKGFFLIDLVSAVPLDLILLPHCDVPSSANNVARAPAFIKRLRMLRVMRLLRVTRVRRYLESVRDTLHINPGVLRLMKFAFFVCLVAHYDACIFFFIGDSDGEREPYESWTKNTIRFVGSFQDEHWGDGPQPVENMTISSQYITSLYWAATTLTTVGFGDVTPVTTWEIGFSMFVIIQGGVALGYVVGSMADLLSRLNLRKKRHLELAEYWESAFHRGRFPASLRRKIRAHHEYVFNNRISKLPEFAEQELSRSLLRDVTAHIYKDALGSLPMFRGLGDEVITELALALDHVQLPPGETLYREGDEGDCMYFLQRGDVQLTMLLMSSAKKKALSMHELSEFVERVGETVTTHELERTGSAQRAQPAQLTGVKTYEQNPSMAKYLVRVGALRSAAFKWGINQRTCSYFGESVLFSSDRQRVSSATTVTGCTLLVLTSKALNYVCRKYPAMREVSKRMERHRQPRLVGVVDKIVHSMRSRGDVQCRLYVTVHEAVNMPKMDNFGGRCDAYAIVDVGPPREGKLQHQTLKVYNTYFPRWNETFAFPIRDVYTPGNVVVNIELRDWDLVGEHDFIGVCHVELSELAKIAWELGKSEQQAPQWYNVLQENSKGKLRAVRGYNHKHAKIKLSFRMVPPPGGKEAAATRPRGSIASVGTVPVPLRTSSAPNEAHDVDSVMAATKSRARAASMVEMGARAAGSSTVASEHPRPSSSPKPRPRPEYKPHAAQQAAPLGAFRKNSAASMSAPYSLTECVSTHNSACNTPRHSNPSPPPPPIPDMDQVQDLTRALLPSPDLEEPSAVGLWTGKQAAESPIDNCARCGLLSSDDPDTALDAPGVADLELLKARAAREADDVDAAEDDVEDVEELRRTVGKLRQSAKAAWSTVHTLVTKFQQEEDNSCEEERELLILLRELRALASHEDSVHSLEPTATAADAS